MELVVKSQNNGKCSGKGLGDPNGGRIANYRGMARELATDISTTLLRLSSADKGDYIHKCRFPIHLDDPGCVTRLEYLENTDAKKCALTRTGVATIIEDITDAGKDNGA